MKRIHLLLLICVLLTTGSIYLVSNLDRVTGEAWSGLLRSHKEAMRSDSLPGGAEAAHRRQVLLNKKCHYLPPSYRNDTRIAAHPHLVDNILVDDKHKILYCYVPKVACTQWKRVFGVLTGIVPTEYGNHLTDIRSWSIHHGNFTRLSNFSTAGILHRLRRYTNLMFVRHPLERLVSAFRNKFEVSPVSGKFNDYFIAKFGNKIISRHRKMKLTNNNSRLPSFSEFVRYVGDLKNPEQFNEHWKTVLDLCHPCAVTYDVIGHYETLGVDADWALQTAGVDRLIKFPTITESRTSQYASSYYSNVTSDEIKSLLQIYYWDLELFGYDPSTVFPSPKIKSQSHVDKIAVKQLWKTMRLKRS